MDIVLFIVSCLIYAIFCVRLAVHALVWFRAKNQSRVTFLDSGVSPRIFAITVLDLIFFRKLFNSNKLVWIGSWTFHLSFFFVALRHLKYFLDPVPGFIVIMQPAGKIAGYFLALSAAYLLAVRISQGIKQYMSWQNVFIIAAVFFLSSSGILMSMVFIPDVVQIKEFIFGILTLSPAHAPDSMIFLFHFLLFLVLIPNLPFHIFTAPAISLQATRRAENLFWVLHEKK